MSNNFVINSSNNVSIYNNTFKYNFINGNYNIPEGAEMCINTLVVPYSFYNVSSFLGNNTFYWTFPVNQASFKVDTAGLSTTITVSSMSAGNTPLQVGSVLTSSSLPTSTHGSGLIYITSLGTGTGGNGTYTINQAINVINIDTTCSSVLNTVSLTNGFYTINDIQNALWASMKSANCYFYNQNPYQNTQPSLGTSNASIIYPISISTSISNYTNAFTFQYIPTSSANVTTQFGQNWTYANTTSNIFPGTASTCQVIIPPGVTNTSINNIGNLLGFISGKYPSSVQTYTNPPSLSNSIPYSVLGNSLTNYTPPFPAVGSNINAIVIRCNLVNNAISNQPDILDCSPISTTFGSNIIYQPVSENWVRLKAGSYSSMIISFTDQNGNTIYMNDPNILLSLLIRTPE